MSPGSYDRAAAIAISLTLTAFSVCQVANAQDQSSLGDAAAAVASLQIVDCLLPGQVRQVGGRPYLTPRRPTRTTAADCGTRGGEYLAYDRADYKSALNVWLPTAEDGDADAQTRVGEIYERGLGGEPNYEAAAEWYRRAAEQGNTRAQFNLGTLYERGLGVPADRLEALNWYRRAWGIPDDSVIFESAAAEEQAELRATLEAELEQQRQQVEVLRRRVAELESELSEQADAGAELEVMRDLLARYEAEQQENEDRLANLPSPPPQTRSSAAPPRSGPLAFMEPEEQHYRQRSFGRYFALIIGVEHYDSLEPLGSPESDVESVRQVLEDKYGFSVITLLDPDQLQIMRAINQLNDTLKEDDNLLIYFAGHGSRLQNGPRETGYWLPVNADPPPDDTVWVSNDFVTGHLSRLKAKRVLVVADSCYAGLLGDDPGYTMVGEGRYSDDYIEFKRPRRSRLVLASGGDSPVLDNGGGDHSVFARAFIEELKNSDQLLTAPELFLRIRERIRNNPVAAELGQDPELKAIKDAGHEVGDFFFVPS